RLTPWVGFRTLYKHMIVEKWWRDGSVGLTEAMLFTIKDWVGILSQWEALDHPEVPIGRGTRAAFSAAEVVHEIGTGTSKLTAAAKRRWRRVVDRDDK